MLQGWIQQEAYRRTLYQEQGFRPEFIGQRADQNEEISELFDTQIARVQRGEPERAMLQIQQTQFSQIYGWLCEHIGDLIQRMSQKPIFFKGGFQFVDEKVGKTKRVLSRPIEVEGIVKQIETNLKFRSERGEPVGSVEEAIRKLEQLGQAYRQAHFRLPTFNRVQRLARGAAMDMGNWDFEHSEASASRVLEALDALDRELADERNWQVKSMTVENPPK